MSVARHPRPPELVDVPLEDIMQKYVGRFRDKKPDWAAFEDAKVEGYKRAQHRFIGAGGSGKHGDPTVIPAKNFTLSIMYVEPGQGNAAHTHEVEECFFVLQGYLDVFFAPTSTSQQAGQQAAGRIFGRTNNRDEPTTWQTRQAQYDAVCAWGVPNHSLLERVSAIDFFDLADCSVISYARRARP